MRLLFRNFPSQCLLTSHIDDVGGLLGLNTFAICLMMGTADELAIAVLGRQVPPDLLHGGGELDVVVGIGGEDFQRSGALVGGHVVNVPRDVCRWATIAHTATGAELGALREEAIAVGLREQLNHGLLGTHCSRKKQVRVESWRVGNKGGLYLHATTRSMVPVSSSPSTPRLHFT